MSQISVSNLTFCYEGSFDYIFENENTDLSPQELINDFPKPFDGETV